MPSFTVATLLIAAACSGVLLTFAGVMFGPLLASLAVIALGLRWVIRSENRESPHAHEENKAA